MTQRERVAAAIVEQDFQNLAVLCINRHQPKLARKAGIIHMRKGEV
jgi:hypothetical protein